MKITDLKHDHSLTNLLKIIIFSILMLTPFFFVATKCLYVISNKNAYQSYYGKTINQKEYVSIDNVNKINNVDTYNLFLVQGGNFTGPEGNLTIYFDNFVDNDNLGISDTPNSFLYYYNNGNVAFQFKKDDTLLLAGNTSNKGININFNYISALANALTLNDTLRYLTKIEYKQYTYLDNVFEYSINQMAQSQLFTWTQNTGIYTGVNAMTTGLGLTSPVIPILISYWFLLTIIYVVIDIVIVCFTTITHMIVKKSN